MDQQVVGASISQASLLTPQPSRKSKALPRASADGPRKPGKFVPPPASLTHKIIMGTAVVLPFLGLLVGIALTWAPTATIQSDYTVFVQVLDAGSNILAQVDSQPQGGSYPTSTWRLGDVITDTITWPGEAGTGGWARVIVGLYGADGKRLPLQDGADHFEVAHSAASK